MNFFILFYFKFLFFFYFFLPKLFATKIYKKTHKTSTKIIKKFQNFPKKIKIAVEIETRWSFWSKGTARPRLLFIDRQSHAKHFLNFILLLLRSKNWIFVEEPKWFYGSILPQFCHTKLIFEFFFLHKHTTN